MNSPDKLVWYSAQEKPFFICGFPWLKQDKCYRRLPLKSSWPIPPAVDTLANNTAGGQIRFQTDSPVIQLKVTLLGPSNMYHMPATGQSGFDCYVGPVGRCCYLATAAGKPSDVEYQATLLNLPEKKMRLITIYFPLYQGVKNLLLGLSPDARLLPPPVFSGGRIIVYGTSITQGGCASRPGMAYTNILSRRFNHEFINLGFSGSGRGEPEMARIISEIPGPACYLLDYEANAPDLRASLPEFIRILREKYARIPILVISRIPFARICHEPAVRNNYFRSRNYQARLVEKLQDQGDKFIFFQDGSRLLGKKDWQECTVDGVHPTDLGFLRMADNLTPVLKNILKKSPSGR